MYWDDKDDTDVNFYVIPGKQDVEEVAATCTKDNNIAPCGDVTYVAVKDNGECNFLNAQLCL